MKWVGISPFAAVGVVGRLGVVVVGGGGGGVVGGGGGGGGGGRASVVNDIVAPRLVPSPVALARK